MLPTYPSIKPPCWKWQTKYFSSMASYSHISLSNPPEASNFPSGENFVPNTSPSCPVSNMIGAVKLDNLCIPCNQGDERLFIVEILRYLKSSENLNFLCKQNIESKQQNLIKLAYIKSVKILTGTKLGGD